MDGFGSSAHRDRPQRHLPQAKHAEHEEQPDRIAPMEEEAFGESVQIAASPEKQNDPIDLISL